MNPLNLPDVAEYIHVNIGPQFHAKKIAEITLLCTEKLNIFTAAFVKRFCDEGAINWDRLIRFNSGKSNDSSQ